MGVSRSSAARRQEGEFLQCGISLLNFKPRRIYSVGTVLGLLYHAGQATWYRVYPSPCNDVTLRNLPPESYDVMNRSGDSLYFYPVTTRITKNSEAQNDNLLRSISSYKGKIYLYNQLLTIDINRYVFRYWWYQRVGDSLWKNKEFITSSTISHTILRKDVSSRHWNECSRSAKYRDI